MSSTLAALQQRKDRLDEELKQVEKQVYDLETTYLNDSSQYGNVLKGFESVLSQTKNTSQKKARNFKAEDRMFSLSSTSSPVVDEIAAEKQEEKTVTTQSGRKAGGGGGVPVRRDGRENGETRTRARATTTRRDLRRARDRRLFSHVRSPSARSTLSS